MKRTLIIILIFTLLAACAPSKESGEVSPVEESVGIDTGVATEDVPDIPADTPAPTAEPSPTEEPELVFQPYLADFSEAADDWEVILSEDTNTVFQEEGQLILEASGISSSVVSSPNSVTKASEITIEVDVSIANTGPEVEGGSAGIVCGYTSKNNFYGFEIDKEGIVYLTFADKRHSFTSLLYQRLKKPDEQKSYHLKAICSSTGLGLIVDGEKVFQYAVTDFQPGRVGLFSTGSLGFNASTSEILDLPNTVAFDNFSVMAMQAEDEWVKEPIDPFDYLNVKEVIYTDDFASSSSAWSFSDAPRQMVKLENEKLVISTDSDETFPWAKLKSNTGFSSGVMAETDFTILPGSYENSSAGFVCDVYGDWTNYYDFYITPIEVYVFKYSGGGWKGYASLNYPIYTGEILETGRTYQLTGICGGGYLAMLVDDVPLLVMAIPEQQIQSVALRGGIPHPAVGEGEAIIEFDNFKLTRLEPINN